MSLMPPISDALAALLIDVGRRGVELATDPTSSNRLRHRPASLPTGLAAGLWVHKPSVLAILRSEVPLIDEEGEYVIGERLGMADELGMPTHPGAPAWLVAVGEAIVASCPYGK